MLSVRNISPHKLLLSGVSIALLLFILVSPLAQAQPGAAAISQGFPTTDKNLANGTLLSLQKGSQENVEIANLDNVNRLLGIVSTQPLIAISGSGEEVQVVISGTTQALVSDINGSVKEGDKITASPISGVGMKATASAQIVGTTQIDFDISKAQTRSITDTKGNAHTVHVGLLPVEIGIDYYTVVPIQASILPPFLQNFINTIAGHDVSALRIAISLFVLLLGIVGVGVLLSSAVHSSIISIGRNPLSETAVQKGLFKIGATSIGVLLLMLIAIYLILRI